MKRGDIHYIQDARTGEYTSLAVIVMDGQIAEACNEIEICYITLRPFQDLPTHVAFDAAGLPSTILCEKVCTVKKNRIGDYKGTLSDAEIQAMDKALALSLGLDLDHAEGSARKVHRDPSREEMEWAAQEMAEAKLADLLAEHVKTTEHRAAADLIRAEAERDTYRRLYTDLLATITKGGMGA